MVSYQYFLDLQSKSQWSFSLQLMVTLAAKQQASGTMYEGELAPEGYREKDLEQAFANTLAMYLTYAQIDKRLH